MLPTSYKGISPEPEIPLEVFLSPRGSREARKGARVDLAHDDAAFVGFLEKAGPPITDEGLLKVQIKETRISKQARSTKRRTAQISA
jgi:hypothetical protein